MDLNKVTAQGSGGDCSPSESEVVDGSEDYKQNEHEKTSQQTGGECISSQSLVTGRENIKNWTVLLHRTSERTVLGLRELVALPLASTIVRGGDREVEIAMGTRYDEGELGVRERRDGAT